MTAHGQETDTLETIQNGLNLALHDLNYSFPVASKDEFYSSIILSVMAEYKV